MNMKEKRFGKYFLFSLLGLLTASFYPLYMGVKVILDMIGDGRVAKENYPKYIIPYTPVALALLTAVLLLPLCVKYLKKYALAGGSAVGIVTFFAFEWLFENKIVVASANLGLGVTLKNWQMYMCYIPSPGELPPGYKEQTPVEILMGNYNPAFKLHFYLISVLLILSILNCLYGFAQVTVTGERKKVKPLILQSVATVLFLGLCILACFTAFFRDGDLQVSPLSACLMALFFIIFGLVGGVYLGSFLMGKKKTLSVLLPAVCASLLTLAMYVGEAILLHGNLYILGSGFFYAPLPLIVLSLADILIVLLSGALSGSLLFLCNRKKPSAPAETADLSETI